MSVISLYDKPDSAAVDQEWQSVIDCEEAATFISAEGEPGGVLVVGDFPGVDELKRNRPFSSDSGRHLRRMLKKYWDGPIALDYAYRVPVQSGKTLRDTHVNQHRSYLASTVADAKPSRIICTGTWAALGVTGRKVSPISARRGYGWAHNGKVPVFFLLNHIQAKRNRFLSKWFEEDLEWALTVDISTLKEKSAWDSCANLVTTKEDAEFAAEALRDSEWIAYDCETVGKLYNDDFEVILVAVCSKGSEDVWLWDYSALQDKEVTAPLLELLEDPKVKVVTQNGKYDDQAIYCAFGTEVTANAVDTRLARKLLEPESVASLGAMQELVGMGGGKDEMKTALAAVIRKCRKKKTTLEELQEIGNIDWVNQVRSTPDAKTYAYGLVDRNLLNQYGAIDALSTARIAELIEERLSGQPELQRTWDTIIRPAANALCEVEKWGVAADTKVASAFYSALVIKVDAIKASLAQMSSKEINLDSPSQVGDFLHHELKAPIKQFTAKGQISTSKAALDDLMKQKLPERVRAAVSGILEYRITSKLLSTYAGAIGTFIRGDGRIHPSYNLDGARSGRISCSNPNLQNIPRADTEFGRMARNCFTAPKGRTLVQFDYSQLELRVAAVLSNDKNMVDIFKSGQDYHQRTAEMISKVAWGISPEQVTKEHRTKAKTVNFGLLYGMAPHSLAKKIGCTTEEAEKIKTAIYGKFPKLQRWCQEQLQGARKTGKVWTFWNGDRARYRPMFRIADPDEQVRNRAENGSWNTPIQGSASDYCLASLAECVFWIRREKIPAKLVITVHDSLLFEVEKTALSEIMDNVPKIMGSWPSNGVPLVVDGEIGDSWGELEKIDD